MNWKPLKKSAPVLALAVLVSACSSGGGSASSSPSASGDSAQSGGSFSFSYMMAAKYTNWLKDLAWYPELLKQTNTQIELVEGGQDDADYAKNLDLKIGSGEFPDAGVVSLNQSEVYGQQGAFLDLKPLIDKAAPNIKAFLDKNPAYANLVTDKDGHIYGLVQEYPLSTYVTFYRSDMFKKAGIAQNPTTIQAFTEDLKKLKQTYNDPNFYPFTGRDGFLKFQEVYGANDKIDAGGKVQGIYNGGLGYDLYSPGFKQLIQWYASIYKDKLIDPEWVAGTQTEDSWQTKMLTGKGAISDDFFTRPSWFMNNGGPTNDPNYDIQVMAPFKTQDGQQSMKPPYAPTLRSDRVFVINSKAENKAEGIIRFMDYVFSDKGQELMHYGVDGVTSKAEGGKRTFITDWSAEVVKPLGTTNNGVYQDRLTFPAPVDNASYYEFLDKLTKSFAMDYFSKYASKDFPVLKYNADQLKQRSELLAKVQPTLDANIVKFVTGSRSMSEWDSFLSEMEQAGYKKIVAIDQAAYDAMKHE